MNNHNLYQISQIKDIEPGNIILHPLYRRDGLLLINQYKNITGSISKNIKNNFPGNLPILLASSESDFKLFMENKIFTSPFFISDLKEVYKAHNQFISIPIKFNRQAKDDELQNDYYKIFSSSPFWESFELLLDSHRLKKRAIDIRKKLLNIFYNNEQLVNLIRGLKEYHDALYIHTINSLSISLIIGLSLELSDEDLINLSLSALLADIGFLDIELDKFKLYLDKPNENKDLIVLHAKLSIDKIKDIDILRNKAIIVGIFEHHELYNGLGLPEGKAARNISLFGRILAISKSYDDMVGGYIEEQAINIIDAQSRLWNGKATLFDPDILKILFAKINIFKTGQDVIINDKHKGTIIGFSNYLEEPLLPKIKLESGAVIDYYNSDYQLKNIKFI